MKYILRTALLIVSLSCLVMADARGIQNPRVKKFIAANLTILAKEIAIGHGESIETLAELLSITEVERFGTFLQANYEKSKNLDTFLSEDILEGFKNIAAVDMQLAF